MLNDEKTGSKDAAMKTIDYYNNHSQLFYDRTINADLADQYQRFLKYLPQSAHILDAGCGVGRDTKYFLAQGYSVTAFDASEKMVELAHKETGQNIRQSTFQDLNEIEQYDGIWAQASLLHIPYHITHKIYQKIHQALKKNGIFYASYKYGDSYMETPERDFYNMNEDTVFPYFENLFEVLEIWTKKDTRSHFTPSPYGLWLNFVVRKKDNSTTI